MIVVSALSRTTLPTRGRVLLRVDGAGFPLAVSPPTIGRTPKPAPTMRAWFGSVEARRVRVVSDAIAFIDVPPAGPGPLTFRLDAVSSDGTTIPGESVTWPMPVLFVRPDLTVESTLARVTRTLLQWLKREVLAETVLTTHTEFDGNPDQWGALANTIDLAKLPALILAGPRLERDGLYTSNVRPSNVVDGVALIGRPARTVDLTFDLTGVSDSSIELLNLMNEIVDFGQRNTQLALLRNPAMPELGLVTYDMMTTQDPQATSRPNESNVRQFTYSITIKGVDIDVDDMATDIAFPVSETLLNPPGGGDPLPAIPGTGATGDVLVGDGTMDPVTGGPLPWPIVLAPGIYQLPPDDEEP